MLKNKNEYYMYFSQYILYHIFDTKTTFLFNFDYNFIRFFILSFVFILIQEFSKELLGVNLFCGYYL